MPGYLIPSVTRAARAVAAPCALSRACVLLVGVVIAPLARGAGVPGTSALGAIRHLFERWDAIWYLDIAAHGYRWNGVASEPQNVVFFPLYPALVRAGGLLLGGHLALAGAIVSLTAFLGACIQLWRLVVFELGDRFGEAAAERIATNAIVLLCAYPFALYFSVVYTESLFLWLALSVCLALRRGAFIEAAAWGVFVGLARPNGAFLVVPLAWLAFVDRPAREGSVTARVAVVAAPAAGTLLYTLYLQAAVGDALAWYTGQAAWHWISPEDSRHLLEAAQRINPVDLLIAIGNGGAALFAIAGLVGVGRVLGPGYALFVAANIVPPLATHGLLSVGRFTSVLFPLFVWVAWRTPARSRQRRIVLVCAVAQLVAAALFFAGRPMV